MICVVCGRKIENQSRYCNECGAFQPENNKPLEKSRKRNLLNFFLK